MNQGNLKKIQSLELEILKEVVKVCDKCQLIYYLAEGTLLGAVRHNGFIPWDDDIDICMPREDYEEFISCAERYLPDYMYVKYYKNEDTYEKNIMLTLRVCDRRHKIKWQHVGPEEIVDLSIDVLPIDGISSSSLERRYHLFWAFVRYELMRCSQVTCINENRKLKLWKKYGIRLANYLHLDNMNTQNMGIKYETLIKKYAYRDSEFTYSSLSEYKQKTICPQIYYGNGRMIWFEDCKFRIPSEAEKILEKEYGNYLELPPISERIPKHNIVLLK